jgi:hypothetical protein
MFCVGCGEELIITEKVFLVKIEIGNLIMNH